MKYLKKFNDHSEYEIFTGTTDFIRPNVSICKTLGDVHYNKKVYPLYFEAAEANSTIALYNSGSEPNDFEYSIDGITWNSYEFSGTWGCDGQIITLTNVGDKVYFRNASEITKKLQIEGPDHFEYYSFQMTGKIAAHGDLTFLLNKNGNVDVLPELGFLYLFDSCSSLITPPLLPSTNLSVACYQYMFQGCTSLTTAPELPATTLASYCYYNMFSGCTSLTIAPELPATTLADYCYSGMFCDCASLTEAPELPANTLTESCYTSMFYGCTSLVAAPELPANTLTNYCYARMFYGCTSLNYVKCLATKISAYDCLYNWMYDTNTSGTFVKKSGISYSSGDSGIPSEWTVEEV